MWQDSGLEDMSGESHDTSISDREAVFLAKNQVCMLIVCTDGVDDALHTVWPKCVAVRQVPVMHMAAPLFW